MEFYDDTLEQAADYKKTSSTFGLGYSQITKPTLLTYTHLTSHFNPSHQ